MFGRFKIVIAAAMVAVSLGGCATFSKISEAVSIGTASITNPVTKTRLNQVESAATLVFAGLNGWRQSCVQGLIPETCRAHIRAVQVYTKQIPPYLDQLRRFVKTNDQVNAIVAYNEISSLIATAKSQAAAGGATIGE
jgi:hypothetical protein